METDKIDSFNKKAELFFKPLLEQFGYELLAINENTRNGQKWSTHHIYIHAEKKLRIEIKQEPYYTDYGFSFFIFNTGTNEYNILYNVPSEKQDGGNEFLLKVWEDLCSNEVTRDIISGTCWKKLKKIPYPI